MRVDVDGPEKVLKVEGKVVLTVSYSDGRLLCDWEETWKLWNELHDSIEYKTIFETCSKLIAPGKGHSKGKTKST